jgi:hypothetical protein
MAISVQETSSGQYRERRAVRPTPSEKSERSWSLLNFGRLLLFPSPLSVFSSSSCILEMRNRTFITIAEKQNCSIFRIRYKIYRGDGFELEV